MDFIVARAHFLLAAAANASAWIYSFAAADLTIGGVVAACTIAVPAVVGAVVYMIRTLGPVWLEYRSKLDEQRAKSMAGSMDRLSRNLEDQREQAAAAHRLADTAAQQADRLQSTLELSEKRSAESNELVKTLTARVSEGNARVDDINKKLHNVRESAEAGRIRVESAESELHEVRAKLDEALAQVKANAATLAASGQKAEDVAKFGAAVADAAYKLADRAAEPGPPPIPDARPDP